MTALAEALLTGQRAAIAALAKPYIAEALTDEEVVARLKEFGCNDPVDTAQLLAAWDVLREYGAPAPPNGKPDPATEPASDRQTAYIAKLADERGVPAPDGPLTKDRASKAIEQLKAGTYNADDWVAPF